MYACPQPIDDWVPDIDGRFLGETVTPRRWNGSKLLGLPTPESILMGCVVQSFSGLDVYSVGGGTVTKLSWGLKLVTPISAPYYTYGHYRYASIDSPPIFNKNPQFELYVWSSLLEEGIIYVLIGGVAGAPATASQKKFGIRIIAGGGLQIVSSDGTTQSNSGTLMTLSTATWYRIRCKLTSGSNIEVWVDGVSKGTKTTNLPSGVLPATHSCPQVYSEGSSAVQHDDTFIGLRAMHDY